MIYACFFQPDQEQLIVDSPLYRPFGLEPVVNPYITKNCPELEDPSLRLQLVEYGCLLWHWRNAIPDIDSWFGITSYRQLDKTKIVFESEDVIKSVCDQHKIASWGVCRMQDHQYQDISLGRQAEICHPGISDFIEDVFDHFSEPVPAAWWQSTRGVYANYWAMHKADFVEYMDYSWPFIAHAITLIGVHPYTTRQNRFKTVTEKKALGYFLERLFILWYMKKDKEVVNVGREMTIRNRAAGV